jgi:hypothetical protein
MDKTFTIPKLSAALYFVITKLCKMFVEKFKILISLTFVYSNVFSFYSPLLQVKRFYSYVVL